MINAEKHTISFQKKYLRNIIISKDSVEAGSGILALGKHCFKKEEYQEARKWFFITHALAPGNLECIYFIGCRFFEQDDFSKAIFWFEQVLEKEPKHLDALYMLASSNFILGNFSLAILRLNEFIKLCKTDYVVYYIKGLCCKALNSNHRAKTCFEKSLALNQNDADVINELNLFTTDRIRIENNSTFLPCNHIVN